MLNSILFEGEDNVKHNSGQSPNNYSGHLMTKYSHNKEVDNASQSRNEKQSKTKLTGHKMKATSVNDSNNHLGEMTLAEKKKKTILIVKRGPENIPVPLGRIVLFCMEKKIVHAFHQDGNKYIVDENLTTLARTLDETNFFRANRQYIININHIKSFRTYERVKLKIEMSPGDINDRHSIIISQETAPAFKKWIHSA